MKTETLTFRTEATRKEELAEVSEKSKSVGELHFVRGLANASAGSIQL